jgi:hypothetical protein
MDAEVRTSAKVMQSHRLQMAKTISEVLGGNVLVKTKNDQGSYTQVTFEVQCTMYPIQNF